MFECLWLHTLHAKPRENEFKSFSGQCLSEYIRQLIVLITPVLTKTTQPPFFARCSPDEMMSDVDVFRPGVLDVVVAEGYGTLVVIVQRDVIELAHARLLLRCPDNLAMICVYAYAVSAMAVSFGYQRPILMVPWRYRKTRLTASREPILLRYVVWSTGVPERLDRTTPPWNPWPEKTLTKCHTMPGEPVVTRKVLSSDDRHDVDVLGQQSLPVGGHRLLL
ncbi:hypothetical protein Tco_0780942 [Tanacetum coccineum]